MRKVCTTVAVTLTALGVLGRAPLAAAAEVRAGARVLDLVRTDQPPAIDGVLDDPAWAAPPLDLSEWMTYNPVRGQKLTQNTEVRLTYDDIGLYIAFHCVDPEPAKVRATMGRRDQLWSDDWVGLSLDAIGNGQQSYDLFVNPLGVQADILDTSTAGEDTAPDWVWDSAGRLTPEGYDVEIRLPWKSVRFTSGAEVKMGVLFWRKVSRIGMSASWPELPDGKWVFECHAPLRLHNLRRPLALEVVPSATFARNEERMSPTAFGKAENDPEVGLSVKYGVTSTTSVEATVNPDFSQVESDAFQVEVNQRYPVFYSEKRPFFMEGMGTFQLAGTGGDAVMSTAVHTRRIVDPVWGGKAAGSLGRVTFAALASSDSAPGRAPDVDRQLSGENRTFLVGRATWSLGRSNYFGVIATDTEFGSGFNRVGGGDLSLRKGAHTWNATLLGSQARPPTGGDETSGAAGQASYSFQTKRWEAVTQTEHYDRNFQMDTAFLKQTGITSNWSYGQLSLYPDEKKHRLVQEVLHLRLREGRSRPDPGRRRAVRPRRRPGKLHSAGIPARRRGLGAGALGPAGVPDARRARDGSGADLQVAEPGHLHEQGTVRLLRQHGSLRRALLVPLVGHDFPAHGWFPAVGLLGALRVESPRRWSASLPRRPAECAGILPVRPPLLPPRHRPLRQRQTEGTDRPPGVVRARAGDRRLCRLRVTAGAAGLGRRGVCLPTKGTTW